MPTRLLEPDHISHTQTILTKRGLTNRATVQSQHGRIPTDIAILAAIGHRFTAKKKKKNLNADARVVRQGARRPETGDFFFGGGGGG